MGPLASILSSIGGWFALQVAARWGYKVALIAAIVGVYLTVWAAIVALIATILALVPVPSGTLSTVWPFLVQFFPSRSAIATAASAYWGTAAILRSFDYWRLVTGLAAKIGA